MAKRKTKKSIRYKRFCLTLFIILIILSIILMHKIYYMNILSSNIFITACILLAAIDILVLIITNKSKRGIIRFIAVLFGLLLVSLEGFVLYNTSTTESFIKSITSSVQKKEMYNIYVLNDSNISDSKDLNEKKVAIYNSGSEALTDAVANYKKKVNNIKSEKYYNDLEEILNAGINKKVDVLLIPAAMDQIIFEEYPELKENYRIIDNITVVKSENIKKNNVNVEKDPFIVYISGIDTYGSIGTVSRSDVNILAVINPKMEKILLVNTPRDYYVRLHSKNSYDKLTHAGIYGVKESLNTLEDLYNIDIAFYFKVNFSSLIKIVDTIGGVDVDSKYSFSYDGYTFTKGKNHLNGKQALAFSRYRKGLPNGDISRGENQEAVIKAILEKISNPSIITKYSSLIKNLSNSFVTNLDEADIYKLAKYQLNSSPKWQILVENATGKDSYKTTFSTGKAKLYVIEPNEDSIMSVKSSIKSILN